MDYGPSQIIHVDFITCVIMLENILTFGIKRSRKPCVVVGFCYNKGLGIFGIV